MINISCEGFFWNKLLLNNYFILKLKKRSTVVWQITSKNFIPPTELISVCLYSRQHNGTDSYENTASSQAEFFFSRFTFWIFRKNIYYRYISKSHLSKPMEHRSNWEGLPEKGIYNQNATHKKIKVTFAHRSR